MPECCACETIAALSRTLAGRCWELYTIRRSSKSTINHISFVMLHGQTILSSPLHFVPGHFAGCKRRQMRRIGGNAVVGLEGSPRHLVLTVVLLLIRCPFLLLLPEVLFRPTSCQQQSCELVAHRFSSCRPDLSLALVWVSHCSFLRAEFRVLLDSLDFLWLLACYLVQEVLIEHVRPHLGEPVLFLSTGRLVSSQIQPRDVSIDRSISLVTGWEVSTCLS